MHAFILESKIKLEGHSIQFSGHTTQVINTFCCMYIARMIFSIVEKPFGKKKMVLEELKTAVGRVVLLFDIDYWLYNSEINSS